MTLLTSKKIYPEFLRFFDDVIFHDISQTADPRISFHTDIYFMQFSDEIIITSPSAQKTTENSPVFQKYTVICGDTEPCAQYPNDVKYNAFTVGKMLFCSTTFIDPEILRTAQKENYEIVHVNQGYAKCSTVPLSDCAIITSDKGIHKKASARGIDSLLVENGGVKLSGFPNGFIGGACAVSGNDVYFTGNLDESSNCEQIREFLKKHGKTLHHLPERPLFDFGSPMIL